LEERTPWKKTLAHGNWIRKTLELEKEPERGLNFWFGRALGDIKKNIMGANQAKTK